VAREIALLTNPTSGKGRGTRTTAIVLPRLKEAGFHVHNLVGHDADEARDLARRSVADGVESLVVVGGDGMVHLAVQELAGSETALGIIPAGTGNDVARYLDIPRSDPQLAADVVVGSRTRRIDLARSGAQYYATVLASGFDSLVNERANAMRWPRGPRRYDLATYLELARLKPRHYTITLDGERFETDAVLVAVGNTASYGGGMRVCPDADPTDGLLDVVIERPMSRLTMMRIKPSLYEGTHVNHPLVDQYRARTVTIAAEGITTYADGERALPLPVTVEAVPGALTLVG